MSTCRLLVHEPEVVIVRVLGKEEKSKPSPVVSDRLPDSIFQSVRENIKYDVLLLDSTSDGKLDLPTNFDSFPGVYTFRANYFRDMPHGDLDERPKGLEVEWVFETKEVYGKTRAKSWGGGMGWTGQPLIVNWNMEDLDSLKFLKSSSDTTNTLSELIFGSLSGLVYFIDFDTGKPTRKPLETGNPIKGTPMIDPEDKSKLFVGQGFPNESQLGFRIYDLFTSKLLKFFPGFDSFAKRRWGAFDSSPLKVGGFYFWPAENGLLYKFRVIGGEMVMHSKLRYFLKDQGGFGIESSMAVYKNYGFFGDNKGNILCVNLETLKPVWHYKNLDDTDASIVIEVEEGVPYLYSGCEVDKQGYSGFSTFVKLNALNGELVWKNDVACYSVHRGDKIYNGGMLSTPLLGQHRASHIIYSVFSQTSKEYAGELIAFDKINGSLIFKTKLKNYSWSSPVAFYDKSGKPYIFMGDVEGNVYLIDGQNGDVIYSELIGLNFEASPLVYKNRIVIGSRGKNVYKLKII